MQVVPSIVTKFCCILQVTGDSQVFNVFEDRDGERQTVYVGSFDDLKTQDIKQLGGIPVKQLEKSFGKSFDGTITGFVDRASKGQAPKLSDPVSRLLLTATSSLLMSLLWAYKCTSSMAA